MDTFGRLPNDVLSQITSLYYMPKIEFVFDGIHADLIVDSISINYKLSVVNPLYHYNGNGVHCEREPLINLKKLIDEKRGEYCYNDGYNNDSFTINIDDTIEIYTYYNINITIPIKYIDIFINAVQKYYDILNAYPKC